jgi:hypothetical protein
VKRNSMTIKLQRSKRNPVAATLRKYKAGRHKDKRIDLTDLHAWQDITCWRSEVYDTRGGDYWED